MNKNIVSILLSITFTWLVFSQSGDITTSVHFIDVGQGDCIFIDSGDYEILIDAGNNQYGDDVSNYIQKYVHGSLELVIATHPDADHIGGLDVILKNYSVSTLIDSGKKHTTKTYNDYMNAVLDEIGLVFINDYNMEIAVSSSAVFSIIELVDDRIDNNENSVVSMLDVQGVKFLFTGDLESDLEIEYISSFSEVDVLKVGHHGSKTSTSSDFLQKINPSYAVISCGKNNRYGHPHKDVLDRLLDNNIKVYRTDIQGTIIATIDDKGKLTFNY